MIIPVYKWAFTVFAVLLFFASPARAVELDEVLSAVQNTYSKADDLKADFEQKKTFEGFRSVHTLTGTVYLKKPGFMRWDYRSPSKQQIFLKGDRFTYYIPEHEQVVISPLSEQQARDIPVHLLSSLSNLDQEYHLEWETEPPGSQKPYRIHLQPKKSPSGPKLLVEVDPKDSLIRKIHFSDPNGNTSTFTFSDFKINKGIPDDFFDFTVPEGVEVVHPPPTMAPQ